MRKIGFIILIMLSAIPKALKAQTAYAGGEGDGYAMAEITSVSLGIEKADLPLLSIYPNPARTGSAVILSGFTGAENSSLQLTNAEGTEIVFGAKESGSSVGLNLSGIAPGIYILHYYSGEKESCYKLVVLP